MAAEIARPARSVALRPNRFGPLGGGLVRRYRRWRLYRHTLGELRALSDRQLADLGLSREILPRIAAGATLDHPGL